MAEWIAAVAELTAAVVMAASVMTWQMVTGVLHSWELSAVKQLVHSKVMVQTACLHSTSSIP